MKQSEHTRYRKHLQLYVLLTQTFVSAFKGPQRHNKSICTSIAFQEILHTDDDVIHYRLRNQLSITSPLTSGQCTVVLNMLETVSPRHQTNDNGCRPSHRPSQASITCTTRRQRARSGEHNSWPKGGSRHDSPRSRFARFRHFARPRSGVYIRERAVDKDNKATARLRDARASCTQSERLNGPEEHCRS